MIGWKIKDFDKYFFKTAKRQPAETVSLQQNVGDGDTTAGEFGGALAASGNTPSQIVMEQEGYQMLERAMKRLPENFRTVIMFRQILKLSAAETAERMEMRANSVNVLFHRAQKRLHEVLKGMSYFK